MSVCVCVCVFKRERAVNCVLERERERESVQERERVCEYLCICEESVCIIVTVCW